MVIAPEPPKLHAGIRRRLTEPLREFGVAAGLGYLIGRALNLLSPQCNLYVYDLMAQPVPQVPMPLRHDLRGIVVRRVERGDALLGKFPIPPPVIQSRFDQGGVCLGAFKGGQILGYIWLLLGAYREDEVRCTYVPDDKEKSAFDFDLYVFPEYRLGRAFVALWEGANEFLRENGRSWTFSRITRFNTRSRRAHARLGARRVGQALFLRLGRLEVLLATVRPYIWVSVGVEGGPKLRLTPPR